jgi:uncharacterized protein (TIGR01244 family)
MNDPEDITAWQRIDARTTTSGKLVAEDVIRLAALGVQHVINLAMDDHADALAQEAELMAAAGLRYTHIPVPFDAPKVRHFEAFVTANAADDDLVHVHCIANMRVSAFLYRYHRDVAGMPESEARALMEQQWSPDTGDHPTLAPWARFITACEG